MLLDMEINSFESACLGILGFHGDVPMLPFKSTATSLAPSLSETIPYHLFVAPIDLSVHDCPKSADVQMLPLETVSASLTPLPLEVISHQRAPQRPPPAGLSVHDCPESDDVQDLPSPTTANFSPLPLGVIPYKFFVAPTDLSIHVFPESQDVQVLPSAIVARFSSLPLEVIPHQAAAGKGEGRRPQGIWTGAGARARAWTESRRGILGVGPSCSSVGTHDFDFSPRCS